MCDSQLVSDRIVDRLSTLKRAISTVQLNSGKDALRFIAAKNPAVVIVDVHLEAGNGMDLLRNVAQREPHPLVIAVSRSAHPQYLRLSMKEGADHFIKLPEDVDSLTGILEKET